VPFLIINSVASNAYIVFVKLHFIVCEKLPGGLKSGTLLVFEFPTLLDAL